MLPAGSEDEHSKKELMGLVKLQHIALTRTPHLKLIAEDRVAMSPDDEKDSYAEVAKLRKALKMLYDLLEYYGPVWYSKRHHDRAEAALGFMENDTRNR